MHGACEDETLRAIYDASLGLAKQLGMGIIAAGVQDRARTSESNDERGQMKVIDALATLPSRVGSGWPRTAYPHAGCLAPRVRRIQANPSRPSPSSNAVDGSGTRAAPRITCPRISPPGKVEL